MQTDDPRRPSFHVTMPQGRLADPNGLVAFGGLYHLFHQADGRWAHLTSTDLVSWRRQPIALEHDALGQALSGSAVVDADDCSGLFGGAAGIAAFYTSTAGGEAQSLAVSSDGATFRRYAANPVIPNGGRRDFRDPKVIWHAPTRRWVMLVSGGDRIELWGSADLISWSPLSSFGDGQGLHSAVWECPGLIELPVADGATEPGERVWVLFVSVGDSEATRGSVMQYFVGDFDGTTFVHRDDPATVHLVDAGGDFYAAQTWSSLDRGPRGSDDRAVWIGWLGNWRYPYELPTGDWRGALSVPRELDLVRRDGTLQLRQRPVTELQQLRGPAQVLADNVVTGEQDVGLRGARWELELALGSATGRCGVLLLADDDGGVEVGVDRGTGDIYLDRTRSALPTLVDRRGGTFDVGARRSAPLADPDGVVRLRILLDVSTLEVFVEDGPVLSATVFGRPGAEAVHLFATSRAVVSLTAYPLRPAW